MSKVRILNQALDSGSEDYLYHFGISKSLVDIPKQFGDVKFVCTGGSPTRMKLYAEMFAKENELQASKDLSSSDRFVMYKTGPVLWVNHGMGTPSLSIMIVELIKLLYYARATDVAVFRLGTSGGLGMPPGTVLISSGCFNGELQECYTQYILGKKVQRPTVLDQGLRKQLCEMAEQLKLPAEVGKTMTADCFYEGQGRLDGAFCEYTADDKFKFLQKLYDLGVRNLEMEATCFAAMFNRANIRAAVVCVTIVNRMKGDQVQLSEEDLLNFEMRPYKLVSSYIKQSMKHA